MDVPPPIADPSATIPAQAIPYAGTGGDGRAASSLGAWLRFLIPAALGLAADLAVKAYAFPDGIKGPMIGGGPDDIVGRHPTFQDLGYGWVPNPPQPVIPNILGFTTTVNHGAVFGIAQGWVSAFLVFSLVAMAVIVSVFVTSRRGQWTVHIALGMITAGALGNLYDRALFGGVRDMFRFYVNWYPYIFNVADVLLCVGVPLLMLRWMLEPNPDKARRMRT